MNNKQKAVSFGTKIYKKGKCENFYILKSASNLNGNLNCSKELEHYAS